MGSSSHPIRKHGRPTPPPTFPSRNFSSGHVAHSQARNFKVQALFGSSLMAWLKSDHGPCRRPSCCTRRCRTIHVSLDIRRIVADGFRVGCDSLLRNPYVWAFASAAIAKRATTKHESLIFIVASHRKDFDQIILADHNEAWTWSGRGCPQRNRVLVFTGVRQHTSNQPCI